MSVFQAGHGPHTAGATQPTATSARVPKIQVCLRIPAKARRASSTTTSRLTITARSPRVKKIQARVIWGMPPVQQPSPQQSRAISTMLAVNHGKRRIRSRPSKTTSRTRSAANCQRPKNLD